MSRLHSPEAADADDQGPQCEACAGRDHLECDGGSCQCGTGTTETDDRHREEFHRADLEDPTDEAAA